MFTYQTTVKMHDTDAAGILFFASQFRLIHDAYEALLESVGLPMAKILREKDFFQPIVHAESNFKSPLFVGDPITIQVKLENIGQTSFALNYTLLDVRENIVGTAKTVHVTVDKKTKTKIPLPPELRQALNKAL